MRRILVAFAFLIALTGAGLAQQSATDPQAEMTAPLADESMLGDRLDGMNTGVIRDQLQQAGGVREETGGAQTLEDILARQRGDQIDDSFRRAETGDPDAAAAISSQLGTLGGASDPELWRALRYGTAEVKTSSPDPRSRVLIQDGGMWWLEIRRGPLITYGLWLLAGMLALLALFYLIRGRVRVEGGMDGRTVKRFRFVERMAHWTLAGSFILLAITGILSLIGRKFLVPVMGLEANAALLSATKFIHDNVAWAFMLGLTAVFVMWVWHNLPDRTDLTWIRHAGGLVGSTHPPAKKFNFGQKVVFWAVILLGGSLSLSGLSLLFPYELPLFAKTFALFNDVGLTGLAGLDPLPTQLAPQEEMQYAQLWHAIIAFVMTALIFGHIYIGTLGMEGASSAMSDGEVDVAWAEQHHSLWLEKVRNEAAAPRAGSATTPAE